MLAPGYPDIIGNDPAVIMLPGYYVLAEWCIFFSVNQEKITIATTTCIGSYRALKRSGCKASIHNILF